MFDITKNGYKELINGLDTLKKKGLLPKEPSVNVKQNCSMSLPRRNTSQDFQRLIDIVRKRVYFLCSVNVVVVAVVVYFVFKLFF